MPENTTNLTVRIPLKNQKKLDRIASDLDRSRNWLINEAVKNYLDVFEWQEKRVRERLKKAAKGGKFLTGSRVNKIVESFKP